MMEKEIKERKKGRHTVEMAVAQVNIPVDIFNAVRQQAESQGFNMTTFWRRYIIEGYQKDKERGLFR